MKKQILLLILLLVSITSYGQRQKFDCRNMNNSKLATAYQSLKYYGLEYVVKADDGVNKDIMEFTIYYLKPNEIQQVCIDAWSEVETNGAEYCYNRYCKMMKYVSKSVYMENIDYFEMLFILRKLLNNLVIEQ